MYTIDSYVTAIVYYMQPSAGYGTFIRPSHHLYSARVIVLYHTCVYLLISRKNKKIPQTMLQS